MANGRPGGIAKEGDVLAGKYALHKLLGRGGMGAVFAGENRSTGRRVAVKVLHGQAAQTVEAVARFMREARITTALAHPNIVEVLDAGQEPEGPMFIVQELLEGFDLRKRMDTPPRPDLRETLDIIVPIMGALAAAHRRGVVHRDLKPENIFLSRSADGRLIPKLIDFGLSKVLDKGGDLAHTVRGAVLGTPAYMAPEQARGAATIDTRADVWAIGAVLFEVFVGRPPIDERHPPMALLRLATTTESPDVAAAAPKLPRDVAAAVRHALEPDPARRWQRMEDFLQALLDCRGPNGAPLGDEFITRHRASMPWLTQQAAFAVAAAAGPGLTPATGVVPPALAAARARRADSIPDLPNALGGEESDPDMLAEGPTVATPGLFAEIAAEAARDVEQVHGGDETASSLPVVGMSAEGGEAVHYSLDPRIAETLGWCEIFLDSNPADLRPFERIRHILAQHEDYAELAFAYRKQIARTRALGSLPIEPMLWSELAALYHDRLNDPGAAAEAVEQARAAGARQQPRLFSQVRAALARAPEDSEALGAMFDLLARAGQTDRAFCVANAMVFLHRDRAPREVLAFYQQYLRADLPAPRARLPRERWGFDVWHPGIDPLVARVFACTLPTLRTVAPAPPSAFGLGEPARDDPASPAGRVLQGLALAAAALNVPDAPRVFTRPAAPEGLAYVTSEPPATVVGAKFLRGLTAGEARALAARHVAYYLPEFYARVLRPAREELRAHLVAALRLGEPGFDAGGRAMPRGALEAARVALEKKLQGDHERWSELRCAASLLAASGRPPDFDGWYDGVELSACRAGFALSGSLAAARRMVALGDGPLGDPPGEDRFRDVLRYAVSEQYFRLREALGLAL